MKKTFCFFKADGENVPDTVIRIEERPPAFRGLNQQDELFDRQAESLEDALHESLPGGIYDRLLAQMLKRKASHLRISFLSLSSGRGRKGEG